MALKQRRVHVTRAAEYDEVAVLDELLATIATELRTREAADELSEYSHSSSEQEVPPFITIENDGTDYFGINIFYRAAR